VASEFLKNKNNEFLKFEKIKLLELKSFQELTETYHRVKDFCEETKKSFLVQISRHLISCALRAFLRTINVK
jgi:hypothetical protein